MRTIKFRGCEIGDGQYRYGDLIQSTYDSKPVYEIRSHYERSIPGIAYYTVAPDSVAQLVGVDKNGCEVYEGDTLTDGKSRFIVELKPQGCVFQEENGRRDYASICFEMTGRNNLSNFTKVADQ